MCQNKTRKALNYIKSSCIISVSNFSNTFIMYTCYTCWYTYIKTYSIPLFSSSEMQKFHHLLGYHATSINYLFNLFSKCLPSFKFNMSSQNSGNIFID